MPVLPPLFTAPSRIRPYEVHAGGNAANGYPFPVTVKLRPVLLGSIPFSGRLLACIPGALPLPCTNRQLSYGTGNRYFFAVIAFLRLKLYIVYTWDLPVSSRNFCFPNNNRCRFCAWLQRNSVYASFRKNACTILSRRSTLPARSMSFAYGRPKSAYSA